MTDEVATVIDRARATFTPDEAERADLESVAEELVDRAEAAIADLPIEAEVLRVGSTARNTWLPGDRDVDLFVRFPPDVDRADLREYGLEVGHAVLPDGREEYAEHPYVNGEHRGFDVDVVPCYDVDSAAEIRSAVDRTPFHTTYVRGRLGDGLAAEVRLAKAFCTGIGVYGSDLRTRGFSGYLLELLVAEYGGFRELLEEAADWQPPVELDPESHGEATFPDSLVVIDPTDPERNVAAVCSEENVARLQHHARAFLADPDEEYFEPDEPDPIDADALREHLDRRGTTPVALRLPAPDLVDDDLYPQLRTSLRGITGELDRRGFDVLRSTVAVADDQEAAGTASDGSATEAGDDRPDALLFAELEVARRPAIEPHQGPPIGVREHAEGFYEKYADDPEVYGPFLDGDRYVVEREREHRTARSFLESGALFDVKHGVAVERTLADGYEVLVGDDLVDALPAFGVALAEYVDPSP